ncbi:MAG: hypothetical protein MJY89_06455 [Bacteroidales bacterium]|nr:hypothetical protein [Bacteroidales bacterium]
MTIKEWDGQPFYAIAIDDNNKTLFISDQKRYDGKEIGYLITGYNHERWIDDSGLSWKCVYPLEWNKKPKKRLTNRELAMWLAKGNGQVKYATGYVSAYHGYVEGIDHEETNEEIKVRKWDSTEWVEPTTDILVDCL